MLDGRIDARLTDAVEGGFNSSGPARADATQEVLPMGTTETQFDAQALKRSIEERDASTQVALFADDATVEVVDKENPPSRPFVLDGRDAIRAYLEDVMSRDMTHSVSGLVVEGDRASYTIDCRYPDGSKVLCLATLELRDGRIVRQRGIQAWDE